ncbi:hypothetical protein VSU16_14440 (plasmid) [Cetobacterium somerae]|uniref:hypothetical protein n=1 Tax=Cetobacterium somerae TaxID=188913 RepID=UPI002E7B431B|nr:hypothetical protein [Cetobacterium somerae]WVJ03119.1 hypothetical protein VSU16_14440 [Cetobacterium somerae]
MKTLASLKINKYTCEKTMGTENHITFILAPKSTITQWVGEIGLIEQGKGRTKKEYDILFLNSVDDLIRFYNENSKVVNKYNKNGKLVSSGIVFDKTKIKKPLYILCGKETFKLSQTKRPNFLLSKYGDDPVLKCPNCGQELIQVKKIDKIATDVPLELEDFFKEDKKGIKKTPKSSNIKCKKCERLADQRSEYKLNEKEAKEMAKEQSARYKKMYFENPDDANKRIPTRNSEVWGVDYRTDNYIRNKMFYKIEPVKELKDSYTVFEDSDTLKEAYKLRREFIDRTKEEYNLLNIKVDDTTFEERAIGYKPKIKKKIKKVSVIEFMKKRIFEFDSTIIDEAHEANKADSLIGAAQKLLFKFSKKVLLLSGTANNGYASSLHSLLSAAMPNELLKDDTFNKQEFIAKYGILQAVRKVDDTGKISGKIELKKSDFKETEGINPVVFTKFLAKNFIMVNSLSQLDLPLPPLVEEYIPIDLDTQIKFNYIKFYSKVEKISPLQAKTLRDKIFKNYINNPYKWQNFSITATVDGIKETFDVDIDNVSRDSVPFTTKDEYLIKVIRKEMSQNRKCFLFTDFINGGEYIGEELWENENKPRKITINDRICKLLEEEGIRYKVITTSTASVIDRKNWIEDNKDQYDVFICQPQLVNVGLNLVFCPTYIVYTPQYRYDIISQATRRGYRANSTEENRVYHLYFKNTCEEEIINRYQRKLAEAKAIEGDFDVNLEKNKNVRTISKMSAAIVSGY